METASENPPRKRRGRKPRNYTEKELKERHKRQKLSQTLYRQRMIGISSAYEAWKALKEKGCWSHGELALHLLDVHTKFCTQPNCASSKTRRDHTLSSKVTEGGATSHPHKRSEKSSNENVPVSDPKAKILASFRPIRRKEELKASGVTSNVKGTENYTSLPKPVSNGNDSLKSESNAAAASVDATPQEDGNETLKEEEEQRNGEIDEGDEDGEGTQGEVARNERSDVDDILTFQENLGQDETEKKDESEGCENDPEWGAELGINIIFNENEDGDEDGYSSEEGGGPREKKQKQDQEVSDLPFQRFDLAEVAKAEGVSYTGINKNRIRKLYWTELERVYRCKLCLFEESDAYSTCRHLLQEHPEVVGDLEEYLKGRPASDSQTGSTLYDMVMEVPPLEDSFAENKESESSDGIGEKMGSDDIPEKASKSTDSGGRGTKDNPLDTSESIELLLRWVKFKVSCKFCQKVIKSRFFSHKGEKTLHRCGISKRIPALCDICGKVFAFTFFKTHWTEVHCAPEQTICPHCGKMMKVLSLTSHIIRCHTNKEDQYRCGICRKGFRTKKSRNTHEVIHQKEKPFKCTYCQRGFTQSTNMKYHMRQHTGEKPYQCNICSESFAHNVSLKNHLKSRHGIDPWKMDSAWD
ncbi:hypothetical protein HOLleu_33476 [Holothuria leucospilota]|uniref:C2H2-type domain-containing protein n=1 Tax=Holothuria leucospilota TaxID=206669 RepID=A0A9Q1BI28_HOLLE|nr:hypothetical protein HOLleu_33476 [Holothuria leucospilota]